MQAEKPKTTGQLIDILVAHYGSNLNLTAALHDVWVDENNRRKMLKIDALWILYEQIQQGVPAQQH